jgi:hypothetical protein
MMQFSLISQNIDNQMGSRDELHGRKDPKGHSRLLHLKRSRVYSESSQEREPQNVVVKHIEIFLISSWPFVSAYQRYFRENMCAEDTEDAALKDGAALLHARHVRAHQMRRHQRQLRLLHFHPLFLALRSFQLCVPGAVDDVPTARQNHVLVGCKHGYMADVNTLVHGKSVSSSRFCCDFAENHSVLVGCSGGRKVK